MLCSICVPTLTRGSIVTIQTSVYPAIQSNLDLGMVSQPSKFYLMSVPCLFGFSFKLAICVPCDLLMFTLARRYPRHHISLENISKPGILCKLLDLVVSILSLTYNHVIDRYNLSSLSLFLINFTKYLNK